MKPEELDALFRRGLAEQPTAASAGPSPRAWNAIQQHLQEPAADADELPAFLRSGPPPPRPAAATPLAPPMLVASRGGAAAPLSASWTQRPLWRAAAVAVLALGGLLTYQHRLAEESVSVPTVASAAPSAYLTPEAGVAVAPSDSPQREVQALVEALVASSVAPDAPLVTSLAPRAGTGTGASANPTRPAAVAAVGPPATQAPETARPLETETETEAGRTSATAAVRRPKTSPVAGNNGFALASNNRPADRRRQATAATPARDSAQSAQSAREETVIATSGEWELVIRPAAAPTRPEPQAPAADETARFVSRSSADRRPITSANDVLRRAGSHLRTLLDRADRTHDGHLTIETEVIGRPVRKTISL